MAEIEHRLGTAVKHRLRKVLILDRDVQAKYYQLERLRSLAEKTTTTQSERVQTSSSPDKFGDIMDKIIKAEQELNDEMHALLDATKEAKRLIDSVENDDYRHLLTMRYLCCRSWEECAVILKCSYRHVHRLHSQALRVLGTFTS